MSKRIEKAIDLIVSGLLELKEHIKEKSGTPIATQPVVAAQAISPEDDLDTFEKLKKALQSDRWPEAVNQTLICDPESTPEKAKRGIGIIELMVEENLKGIKFLDYGCGEGHTTAYAAEKGAKLAMGYDPKAFSGWDTTKDNLVYTSTSKDVEDNGPYDVILLFDVLDHATGEDPISVLKKLNSVLTDSGRIYARMHPFTSRHATHLYYELNKAYLHLVFTPQEIAQLIPNSKYEEPSVGVTMPIATYNNWVEKSGLKVINRREVKENVEAFFKIPKIAERIMKATKAGGFPEYQMSLQFIDLVLGKNLPVVPQPEPQQTV